MIHYPDTDCEIHCDVRTEEPVCLICLIEDRDRLRKQLEEAERDRDSFADGLLIADFYTECPECGEYIDNGPHHPDCKYTDVIARARSIVDRQQPQGGEDEQA